jgi:hypothetical protein
MSFLNFSTNPDFLSFTPKYINKTVKLKLVPFLSNDKDKIQSVFLFLRHNHKSNNIRFNCPRTIGQSCSICDNTDFKPSLLVIASAFIIDDPINPSNNNSFKLINLTKDFYTELSSLIDFNILINPNKNTILNLILSKSNSSISFNTSTIETIDFPFDKKLIPSIDIFNHYYHPSNFSFTFDHSSFTKNINEKPIENNITNTIPFVPKKIISKRVVNKRNLIDISIDFPSKSFFDSI